MMLRRNLSAVNRAGAEVLNLPVISACRASLSARPAAVAYCYPVQRLSPLRSMHEPGHVRDTTKRPD